MNTEALIIDYYTDIFGDVATKMETQWQEKGAYFGFAEHLQHAATQFEHAPVHNLKCALKHLYP
ncbi:hypothetical protein [Psychromonas hadalis]|uniref:hypothetical protein n=1 Tax=Psychromonas hadalis TaxID=211669 RepID=UPI0003B4697B|nr:hypothetical protein [Psychromonas hadalis]